MIDIVKAFKGHLTIECVDKQGKITDSWAENNLIMETARVNMAELLSGITAGSQMSRFILGTEGHNGDYLTPKTAAEGFVSTRTELFSEENASYTYAIDFENTGSNGPCTVTSEPDSGSTVELLQSDTSLTYTIDIPVDSANNGGVAVFTEAALYAGDKIFSMKCFNGKIKDNSVSLRIVWKITF